jgi:predicted nucleotidyltransferase
MEKIKTFMDVKKPEHYTFSDIEYLVPGGSFVSGTNDETSDFDFRAIVLLEDDYYIGLKKFEHQKLISGEGNINNSNEDMDLEVFELLYFVRRLIEGDIIPFEMIYLPRSLSLLSSRLLQPILDHRELFLSKQIAAKYWGFIHKCLRRMDIPAKDFKKQISVQRVNAFGYETKEAMNAIKVLRLTNELLETGETSLMRKDKAELMQIKRGEWSKSEVIACIEALKSKNKDLFVCSNIIPEKVDFAKANDFYKKYVNFVFEEREFFKKTT